MSKVKKKKGIERRFFTSLLIVGILPGVLVILLMFLGGKNSLVKSNGDHLREIAEKTSDKLHLFLQYKTQEVKNLAQLPYLRDLVEEANKNNFKEDFFSPLSLAKNQEIENFIQNYLRRYSPYRSPTLNLNEVEYLAFYLTNSKGDLLNKNDYSPQVNLSSWEQWKRAFARGKGKIVVSNIEYDPLQDKYIIKIATPIIGKEVDAIVGVLITALDCEVLCQMMAIPKVGKSGFVQLIDSSGKILFPPAKNGQSSYLPKNVMQNMSKATSEWIWFDQYESGDRFQVGFAAIKPLSDAQIKVVSPQWTIFVAQEAGEALTPLYSLLWKVAVFGFGMILILALVELYRAHKIATPLNLLMEGAVAIGKGTLEHRIQIKTGDELEALADEINLMTEKLQKAQFELRSRNKELSTQNEMMRAMANSLHIDEILSILVEQIRKHLEFDRVGLYLVDKTENVLIQRIGTDVHGHVTLTEKKSLAISDKTGPMGEMIVNRQKIFVTNNYFEDPRVDPSCLEARMSDNTVTGRALVAIVFRNDILGIIALDNLLSGKVISEENVKILENFADSVGISVKNAQLYQALEKTNEELKKSNEVKTNFVSMVSHELRTPLMIIKESVSQVLDGLKGNINEAQRDFLMMSKNNISRLNLIIEELLAVSRIESGKVELKRELIDIEKLIQETVASFQIEAQSKKIRVETHFDLGIPKLYIDPPKIIQVLNNLVGNAFKFTYSEGQITIGAKKTSPDCIEIFVRDSGIGIPKKLHDRIFERFERADSTPIAGAGSTGLGLSIAKDFIQMHKGNIWVESEEGQGSLFSFTLPIYKEEDFFHEFLDDLLKKSKDQHTLLSLLFVKVGTPLKPVEEAEVLLEKLQHLIRAVGLRTKGQVLLLEKREIVILAETDRTGAKAMEARICTAFEQDTLLKESFSKDEIRFSCVTYPKDGLSRRELLETSTKNFT